MCILEKLLEGFYRSARKCLPGFSVDGQKNEHNFNILSVFLLIYIFLILVNFQRIFFVIMSIVFISILVHSFQ